MHVDMCIGMCTAGSNRRPCPQLAGNVLFGRAGPADEADRCLGVSFWSLHSVETVRREAMHRFFDGESDWGWTSFGKRQDIVDPANQ